MQNNKESKMIKITHVITDSNIGGAGILLCNLLSAIDRSSFDFKVILPRGAALSPRLAALGVPVYEADISPDRSFSFSDLFLFRRLLSREKPDILHTHGSFSARLAGRFLSLPHCILTRHCDTPLKMPAFVYNASASLTVCTSEPLYRHMLSYGVPDERLRLIINGAEPCAYINKGRKEELRRYFGIPDGYAVIGTVGRLERIKGQGIFLLAAREVLKNRQDCIFMLVGDGSCRAELEAFSCEAGISENVRFCGHRENVGEILNLFDISVNSSTGSETSCLAISESLSLGIPVVASDIEGNRCLLKGGECGDLFKNGDTSSLADALLFLLENEERRKRLGEKGLEHYRRELTLSVMAKKYEELYLGLVDN